MLTASISVAQEGTTSPYSFFGIGTLKFKGTAENRTMGGISVFADSIHLNIQNPAAIADLKLVNFSVAGSHKYNNQKTSAESQKTSTTTLDYLALGIPMGKFGASFGLIPYTAVGYRFFSTKDSSRTIYSGSGGLNKAFLALGYKITEKLNFGVDVNYNFGNIENISTTFQEDFLATREFNKSDLLGFSFNLGVSYKTMVTEKLELTSMITYTPETTFTSDNIRQVGTLLITPSGAEQPIDVREVPVTDTEFKFPSQITLEAGIGQPKYWGIGAGFTNQKISNFTNRTNRVEGVTLTNANKYRVGGFYIPNYNALGSYLKRMVYRGGFRFEQTGINVAGTDINEFGISFGVGLPVGKLFTNFNLGFEIGKRGTKDFGLVQENFFNTFLSFSLNDRWFEKRYYE